MSEKTILGVKFFSGSAEEAVEAGLRGGLVVVPSAPVLVDMTDNRALNEAILKADLAITDSGLMVLMWWLLKREKLERVSGLEYLQLLLRKLKELGVRRSMLRGNAREPGTSNTEHITENAGGVFWVMPTEAARDRNLAWLRGQGHPTTVDDCYVAPHYGVGELHDEALVTIIRQRRPTHIIIALGGGVQERVGYALKNALTDPQLLVGSYSLGGLNPHNKEQITPNFPAYRPGIHCIGAAIGFLSGEQVRIPLWVDYLYLGWLWRSVSAPAKFVPRYWKAARLVPLMIRYGEKAPGAEQPVASNTGRS